MNRKRMGEALQQQKRVFIGFGFSTKWQKGHQNQDSTKKHKESPKEYLYRTSIVPIGRNIEEILKIYERYEELQRYPKGLFLFGLSELFTKEKR